MNKERKLLAWYMLHELDAILYPDIKDIKRILKDIQQKGEKRIFSELRESWLNDGTNDEFYVDFPEKETE